jgi:Trypsin
VWGTWVTINQNVSKYWFIGDRLISFSYFDGELNEGSTTIKTGVREAQVEGTTVYTRSYNLVVESKPLGGSWTVRDTDAQNMYIKNDVVWTQKTSVFPLMRLYRNGSLKWPFSSKVAKIAENGDIILLSATSRVSRYSPDFLKEAVLDPSAQYFRVRGNTVLTHGWDGVTRINGASTWGATKAIDFDVDGNILWVGDSIARRYFMANGQLTGESEILSTEIRFALIHDNRLLTVSKDNYLRLDGTAIIGGVKSFYGVQSRDQATWELDFNSPQTLHVVMLDDSEVLLPWLGGITQSFPAWDDNASYSSGQAGGIRGITGAYQNMDAVPKAFQESVVKISYPSGPGKISYGSGTILQDGNNFFVLTAAHVVEGSCEVGGKLCVDASRITVTSQTVNGAVRNLAVQKIYGRAKFSNKDLALIQLTESADGIVGARLPVASYLQYELEDNETHVASVGYGLNDSIFSSSPRLEEISGQRRFGIRKVDGTDDNPVSEVLPDGTPIPGLQIVFESVRGAAASQHGDSGGPDFRWAGKMNGLSIPEIIGVHSYGETSASRIVYDSSGRSHDVKYSKYGDSSASVMLTSSVRDEIMAAMQEDFMMVNPSLSFQLYISEDGDGGDIFSGSGEWVIDISISGGATYNSGTYSFDAADRGIFNPVPTLGANLDQLIAFKMFGYEDDGNDDAMITPYHREFAITSSTLAYQWISLGFGRGDDDIDFWFSYRVTPSGWRRRT